MIVKHIDSSDFTKGYPLVKVTECGNVIEVMETTSRNTKGSQIQRIDEDHYINKKFFDADTGEIKLPYGYEFDSLVKEFKRTENRGQNIKGMKQSMKKLRDLINCNVTNPLFCRWITLTYAQNMTDPKQLYKDHKNFIERLHTYHKNNGLPDFEYISCVEPQGRGAWHVHSLWIYRNTKAPYLPNEDIRRVWGHGFVTVRKVENVDNVGAYLTAYMCDVEVDDFKQIQDQLPKTSFDVKTVEVEENGKKIEKKYVKGARLYLYPNKMNFYRASRGVKKPVVEWMTEEKAKEKVSEATETYRKTIRLTDDETGFTNDLNYTYYNTIRGESQSKKG